MSLVIKFICSVLIIQMSIDRATAQEDPWFADTFYALETRYNLVKIIPLTCNLRDMTETQKYSCIIQKLDETLPKFETFFTKSQLTAKVYWVKLIALKLSFTVVEDGIMNKLPQHLESSTLKEKYDNTMGKLVTAFKANVEDTFSEDPIAENGYVLPLDTACASLSTRNVPQITVKDICPTLQSCADSPHSSTTNGCTSENKCDVRKALPLMMGLFFYKLSFAFVDKFCMERCPGGCRVDDTYIELIKEVRLMKAFISMIPEKPFDQFYRDAITQNAYSNLRAAMELIGENESAFKAAPVACTEIEAEEACDVVNIYLEYVLLKKLQNERQNPIQTKDLRRFTSVSHPIMLRIYKQTLQHISVLSAIDALDENLRAQVTGITNYFKELSSLDEEVANADVLFLQGKLTEYDEQFDDLVKRLGDDMKSIMDAMVAILTLELAEETAKLVLKIAENANPIKAILSGVDAHGILEQSGKVAADAANLAQGVSLFVNLQNLAEETSNLGTDLHSNQEQITTLTTIVNNIVTKQPTEKIYEDADKFIEEYSAYTPKVDRSRMAQDIAMWAAFLESTCNLLTGVEGIGSSVGKGIVGGKLMCERLEGVIAEFGALRENIFDFQFDLVDSLARVMRGNVAKKMSSSIQNEDVDFLKAGQIMTGFLLTQYQVQSQAWLYCDKIEYKNEGTQITECSRPSGLFTTDGLDGLSGYEDPKTYRKVDRTVYIPSKPQFKGDLGFIHIPTLLEKKEVSFRLPLKTSWLMNFHWMLFDESTAPYVESFQLFLPKNTYTSTGVQTSTRLTVTADSGSYIDVDSPVVYKLPEAHSSYVTVYEEGHRSATCANEIENPYSLCDNLPKICHVSSTEVGDSLLPTTLSRWRVRYTVQSGADQLEWLAPNPTTNLLFIAKLIFRENSKGVTKRSEIIGKKNTKVKFAKKKKSSKAKKISKLESWNLMKLQLMHDVGDPVPGCCQENTYREKWNTNNCVDCPVSSTSTLGGYYCEAD